MKIIIEDMTVEEAYALYDHVLATSLMPVMTPEALLANLKFRDALKEALGDEYRSHGERWNHYPLHKDSVGEIG